MKLNKITDLRQNVDNYLNVAHPIGTSLVRLEITIAALKKIANGSCGHAPTWAKEVLRMWAEDDTGNK